MSVRARARDKRNKREKTPEASSPPHSATCSVPPGAVAEVRTGDSGGDTATETLLNPS